MSDSPLLTIPTELLIETLSFLDAASLCRCREVCRDLKTLVDSTSVLQYKIELYATGTESSILDNRNVASRLEKLKSYDKGWAQLAFSARDNIPMKRGGVWELYGGVLAQNSRMGTFYFNRLPSTIRGIKAKAWTMEPPSFQVRDFGMDPSQDLLVMIERPKWSRARGETTHTLHLLSLENNPGQPHPLPRPENRVLHLVQGFRDPGFSYTIQVSGDHIGLLVITAHYRLHEFVIWNWKTGNMLLDTVSESILSFSFLSDEHALICYILPDLDEDDQNFAEPTLTVVNFMKEGNEKKNFDQLKTTISFRYPPLNRDLFIPVAFEVRSDPSPPWEPRFDVNVPFHLAKNHRVYIVSLWVQVSEGIQCLMMFVPLTTFMKHLEQAPLEKEENRIRIWDEWGPTGTRLMISPHSHSHVWVCYVYGTRYVALESHNVLRRDELLCRTYDFNQPGLRRALRTADESQIVREEGVGEEIKTSTETIYQLAPTVIPEGDIFAREVRTSLPYRWRSIPLGDVAGRLQTSYSVMCTEDNLIVIDQRNNEYIIHSF
ncbi:hypothetical protein CC1G_01744 [Coprinopsis cinerea okayama7|uniref:F-box domain-containing protein n=1 Tax=Coprinopsis cinerea (strain Okayama-7 / 130 / ATCC MYA-4618 / FGSC 9003) TaxID=240176 RepID=A8N2M7_COPC7|nr:hypothetical protein CC1G_01744 [Coprinopsis cinerea okayama7\|eukprot:XP_001829064.2 hypothetical protein CC1G_01744 [Coprinopsis cinerea okayama7\